jgi:hypothetical protein
MWDLGCFGVATNEDAATCAGRLGATHDVILTPGTNRPQTGMHTQPMGTKSAPCLPGQRCGTIEIVV